MFEMAKRNIAAGAWRPIAACAVFLLTIHFKLTGCSQIKSCRLSAVKTACVIMHVYGDYKPLYIWSKVTNSPILYMY